MENEILITIKKTDPEMKVGEYHDLLADNAFKIFKAIADSSLNNADITLTMSALNSMFDSYKISSIMEDMDGD